jgi:hypothetical protein
MPGARIRPAAAVLALVCVALLPGCEADGGDAGEPAASAPSSTATPEEAATTTDAASEAPGTSSAECEGAERRAARNIWLWEAVREVTGAPAGVSDDARDTVAKHTEKAATKLRAACGGRAPQAFERFSATVRPILAKDQIGNHELDRVLVAWVRWGTAAGAPESPLRELRDLDACRREFFPRFTASHRVWWKWTDTGKAWWVEITFDNRTGKVLDGGMGGMARATNLLEDPFGWEKGPKPGPGKDARLSWGGSSAEVLELQPGVTELTAAPDIDNDVHTTADGTFRVTELTVGLGPRGERYQCSPPVPPTG